MNDEELSARLRALPRRTAPTSWRREILAAAESPAAEPTAWWRWIFEPSRAGWGALAAVWLLIFALRAGEAPPARDGVPPLDPAQIATLLLSRQQEWREPAPLPASERPTSQSPRVNLRRCTLV